MLNALCSWTENRGGFAVCAAVSTVAGLHLMATPPQKVLGILPKFSFEFMGREMGAQQLVGLAATVCGVCGIGACCM
jgi:hypothetical protein